MCCGGVLAVLAAVETSRRVAISGFRDVDDPAAAFAANLLGAMAGGVIEYVSLITGYRALLIVIAGLYGLALLTGRRHPGSGPAAAAPASSPGPATLESL